MYKTSIKLEDYAISESYLDHLSGEFCGKMLAPVGGEDTIDIEFENPEYRSEFERALKGFKKKLDL